MRHPFCVLAVVIGVLSVNPTIARAQIPVIDAANLIETAQTAINTYQMYRTLMREYEILVKMARRLPGMTRYITPDVPMIAHEASRYPSAALLLDALNSGDPGGERYVRVVRPAQRLQTLSTAMDAEARTMLERAYATIDVADSTASLAAHQLGHIRGFTRNAAGAIAAVERDTVGGSDDLHQQTAILDRINAAEVIARRQDTATNQLLSHLLEQLLVTNKRERDAEAVLMNMRINQLRYYRAYSGSFFTESAASRARDWRQP